MHGKRGGGKKKGGRGGILKKGQTCLAEKQKKGEKGGRR